MSLFNETTTVWVPLELARQYRVLVIVWEHQFFGGSMPFPFKGTTGITLDGYQSYKYFNIEQALEDTVYFATHLELSGYQKDTLSPKSTPWIWIGGSHPLSAPQ